MSYKLQTQDGSLTPEEIERMQSRGRAIDNLMRAMQVSDEKVMEHIETGLKRMTLLELNAFVSTFITHGYGVWAVTAEFRADNVE